MSRISGMNTKPEVQVRSLLHKMGYRSRIHKSDLPGKPDIVLPKHKKVIFVHGCFWHGHPNCPRAKRPSTNREFWKDKLDRNQKRDRVVAYNLRELGWDVLVVWTCEIKDTDNLKNKLLAFLRDQEAVINNGI